ncbi:hypothetical protein [Streptomyces sp. OR43]|uniref:hypothetical protein n=1 Tax=Streptomyces sp. or43 TaxID=2478957 RepID=UPI0011CD8E43|nr:hypothetical protein [Streptomyces sp. or43]
MTRSHGTTRRRALRAGVTALALAAALTACGTNDKEKAPDQSGAPTLSSTPTPSNTPSPNAS